MHRLLIVDDDEILRTGIEKNIDWKANGFEVVGTAANGRECLEMIQNCVPDIILTDIKMPFMDGMQLAEAIYNLYPVIKIVLLTAYEDFSYAKKALGFKVCEYVMKYEDNEAIVNAVKKAAKEYDKRKNDTDILKKSSQLLINKFFYDLMFLNNEDKVIQEQISQLGLNMPGKRFQMICVQVAVQQVAEKQTENYWQQEQLRNQMGILLSACLTNETCHAYFFVARERLNILVNIEAQNGNEHILDDATLLAVIENIQNTLSVCLILGLGNAYDGYASISKSYEEANQALVLHDVLQTPDNIQKVIHIADVADNTYSGVLRAIREYIMEHYNDKNLSLNLIAEEVHLTPSYISTIFKKYCQINIIDFIIEVRMKHAKEMLEKTDLKFYEIAEKIGYANSQYFSVLFKKNTGMSPTEYRQNSRATEQQA